MANAVLDGSAAASSSSALVAGVDDDMIDVCAGRIRFDRQRWQSVLNSKYDTTFSTLSERLGQWSDLEYDMLVDELYADDHDFHLQLVDNNDRWTTERHPLNERGDEDSTKDREDSVWGVGILDLRSGAWLVPRDKSDTKSAEGVVYLLLHWGTLLAGAKRAYDRDTTKQNKAVQLSVLSGVKHCKKYNKLMPPDAIRFKVDVGNVTNNSATTKTFLEVYRCTRHAEQAWAKKKHLMGWTCTSVGGQRRLDEKKFMFMNGLHPKLWPFYRSYEICNLVFKEASKDYRMWVNIHMGMGFRDSSVPGLFHLF
jgi:hypothetical protein